MTFNQLKWITYDKKSSLIMNEGESVLSSLEKNRGKIKRESGSVLLKKTFPINDLIISAKISVCGLGIYKLYINDRCVNPDSFDPAITSYHKRILYDIYDVTELLTSGENTIIAEVGGGYFCPPEKYWGWRMAWLGNPKLALHLSCKTAEGRIAEIETDDTWSAARGGVLENCIYDGVMIDFRKYDHLEWKDADITDAPCTIMEPNVYPKVKVYETYLPDQIIVADKYSTIYGFPLNKTGFVKIGVSGKPGDERTIKHAERLSEAGLDVSSNRKAENTDTFILRGNGAEYITPQFTYHGFKYIQCIKSSTDINIISVEQQALSSNVELIGEFKSDNKDLNKLHNVCVNTMRNSYFGIPLDCPQRDERLAWYGDAHVTSETSIMNFNMRSFYKKCFDDLRLDAKPNGAIPIISPRHCGESSVDFSGGYHIILMLYYKYYNDSDEVIKHLPTLIKYIDYIINKNPSMLLPRGKYGDWSSCEPGFVRGDPYYSDSLFFYYILKITVQLAFIAKNAGESERLEAIRINMSNILMDSYYDKEHRIFGDGGLYTTAFSILLGLIPKADITFALEHMKKKITDNNYCLYTGIFGTKFVLEALYMHKCYDIIEKVILNKCYPGWLYMIKNSTTLTERWDAVSDSLDHGMFSSVDAFLYKLYAGINIDFTNKYPLVIRPYFNGVCRHIKASANINSQKLTVQWCKKNDTITMIVICPDNINGIIDIETTPHKEALLNNVEFENNAVLEHGENIIIIKI